ncbi:MAG: YraN family protein [Acidiphilium sp. 21-66-27]|nr:MAG: YraN family protein [Acidiphilium sp. 21-66-27]
MSRQSEVEESQKTGLFARRRAELRGRGAETLVANWYGARGFEILARRLRTPAGEIDLVVANREVLAFVEVKARAAMRAAADALTPRQRRRLVAAAEIALGQQPGWARPETRFDVILVTGEAVHPIFAAFRADDG